MTGSKRRWRAVRRGLAACLVILPGIGCRAEKRVGPAGVANAWLKPAVVAVAPAVNLSGSTDFDPARFADLMASELSYAEGVRVVPVSRVLGALSSAGWEGVGSPEQAMELATVLGADAILVFAVTEYDPYDPPSIGIAAQLYGAWPGPGLRTLDAVALSRQAALREVPQERPRRGILAQTQRVFDASHGFVVQDIRNFASLRDAGRSPYGWRRYVVTQEGFIRYCCYATIRALLGEDAGAGGSDKDEESGVRQR